MRLFNLFSRKKQLPLPVTPEEINKHVSPAEIFILSGNVASLNYSVRRKRGDAILFDEKDIGKPAYPLVGFGPGARLDTSK